MGPEAGGGTAEARGGVETGGDDQSGGGEEEEGDGEEGGDEEAAGDDAGAEGGDGEAEVVEEERQVSVKKTEIISRQEESNNMEEMKRLHEQKILERQRLEMMISQESKVTSGQVSKRADDVHGLGWGNVTTGFVNRKKLGFLQRATDSMERDWSAEASPAPSGGRRVTWADSSSGSRPDSRLQDVDTVRVQTPPLAGEWAVARSAEKSVSQQSSSFSHQ